MTPKLNVQFLRTINALTSLLLPLDNKLPFLKKQFATVFVFDKFLNVFQ